MPEAPNNTRAADIRRIFFALWPEDGLRARLSAAVPSWALERAKPVPRANLHLTLAFVGNVERPAMDCMAEAAAAVTAAPFTLEIDRLGSFARAAVLWLGCSRMPGALETLARDLQSALEPCGYEPEHRRFAAHVTVGRKFRRALRPRPVDPVSWSVDAFVLVASRLEPGGARYEVLRRYPLRADPAAG